MGKESRVGQGMHGEGLAETACRAGRRGTHVPVLPVCRLPLRCMHLLPLICMHLLLLFRRGHIDPRIL